MQRTVEVLLVAAAVCVLTYPSYGVAGEIKESAPIEYIPMIDPVDTCLFKCESCYKGYGMLRCANECIETKGNISKKWRMRCGLFDDANLDILSLFNTIKRRK
ncbi:PREDICTED: uncharacterized protein LOC106808117 [Priapulus caudatus]|uniref:Uncharacterized protein LOC106808117 n=1 Tax=Priapulus caudatus TaxID=37621 RepID=A0ABM1E1V6_PRICU|nr:PREDICTED: uncharacterized protein LOC106808117 [Priapulus caudatus]